MLGVPLSPGASLVGDYIPTATQQSVEAAIELLRVKLSELGDRIDVEAVNKEEFAELFESSYLLIQRTHSERKRDAAVSLLLNLLLKQDDPKKLGYTELDHFARCLDLLSTGSPRRSPLRRHPHDEPEREPR